MTLYESAGIEAEKVKKAKYNSGPFSYRKLCPSSRLIGIGVVKV
jgi:hypothetical protein